MIFRLGYREYEWKVNKICKRQGHDKEIVNIVNSDNSGKI